MKIRYELNTIVENMRLASQSWDGGEKILLGGSEVTISQLGDQILEKLNGYMDEEGSLSLKGRLETLQKLESATQDILKRTPSHPSLLRAVKKVEHTIRLTFDKLSEIRIGTKMAEPRVMQELDSLAISNTQKLINSAFRTVKGLDKTTADALNQSIDGSPQYISFLSICNELIQFLAENKLSLSQRQVSEVEEVIASLTSVQKIGLEMTKLFKLDSEQNALEYERLKQSIANMAYGLELEIDRLEEGKSVIIPGGYVRGENDQKTAEHTVLYQVLRAGKHEYHFSVFNTGEGAKTVSSGKTYVPLYTNLPKEAVTNQEFLTQLLSLKIEMAPDHQIESIQQIIKNHLVEKHHGRVSTREPLTLQTWNTHSFDSVLAFLAYQMRPSLFIPFQYSMMLRARSALNSLLEQDDVKNAFSQSILNLIDKESCKTIAEWKKKFEDRCQVEPNDELFLAKSVLQDANVKDVEGFRDYLNQIQNSLEEIYEPNIFPNAYKWTVSLAEGINYLNLLGTKKVCMGSFLGATFTGGGSFGLCLAMIAVSAVGFAGTHIKPDSITSAEKADGLKKYLKLFDKALKRQSFEQHNIMENRNEEFGWLPGSSKNRVVLGNLYLDPLFKHLKERFEEIALCSSQALINTTMQGPLRESLTRCNLVM